MDKRRGRIFNSHHE